MLDIDKNKKGHKNRELDMNFEWPIEIPFNKFDLKELFTGIKINKIKKGGNL